MHQSTIHNPQSTIHRLRILVRGIVQGVGFRPFVYGAALRYHLGGFVLNDSDGVTIEVEGDGAAIAAFERALRDEAPPLARVDALAVTTLPAQGTATFAIAHSAEGSGRRTLIAPDVATCDDCLRELGDPGDRRFGYPFINCTNCGPRFTIVRDVPYDRDKTTMAAFALCPACRREYENPLDRRFHAQPTACAACGPMLDFRFWILDCPSPSFQNPKSKIQNAAGVLATGAILAIKGLGGYHLACDALDTEAVARLRGRKHREAKPFALMLPDLQTARALCEVSDAEAELLASRRRPIVLLRARADSPVAPAIAPGQHTLGVMLPYTPLHHLLLAAFAAEVGPTRPAALVMTSGNVSDEPIAYQDDDARERLAAIADGMLDHNRPIYMRCDDSVARVVAGGQQLVRRSRGYAPEPIMLAREALLPILAVGGHLKNTFCLVKGRQAFVSHHIGDLENLETLTSFREGIAHFQRLFDIAPQVVAYDMHPEYLATKEALAMVSDEVAVTSDEFGVTSDGLAVTSDESIIGSSSLVTRHSSLVTSIAVQHHHAHIASVLAEHGLYGPVIGIAADGTGYGTDGAIWGGEVLLADLRGFERLAHLAYMPLPGGDGAVREPWRVAATLLQQAYGDGFLDLDIPFVRGLDRGRWKVLAQMIAKGVNSPHTSSMGRLFDGVAALVGVRTLAQYEGQAAIELEQIAQGDGRAYSFAISSGRPAQLDTRPLIGAIVADIEAQVPIPVIAGRFHTTVAAMLAAACVNAREQTGVSQVALSGGVFQNKLLLELLVERLEAAGFTLCINRQVPPNDGGLSLGQAAIAAARLHYI